MSATCRPDPSGPGAAIRGFVLELHHTHCAQAGEAERRDSAQWFRQIVQTVHQVFWVVELCPERALYVSPAFREVWGRDPEELFADPRVWIAAIHPDDRPRVQSDYEQWIRDPGGREYNVEFRTVRTDDELRWLSCRGIALPDEDGPVRRITGIAEDITARKTVEEALRIRTDRYQLVVAGAHDAIWDWDIPRHRVFFSPQWKALRGFADDEIADGEGEWSSRIHPDDAPRVMEAVQAHLDGRTDIFAEEYRTRCKDGTFRWIFDQGLAQRDEAGRVVRMAGSESDITERKRLELALRASEQFKQEILDALPAHVAVLDPNGFIVAVNEPWREFARRNGGGQENNGGVGTSYLGVCRRAGRLGDSLSDAAADGIESVLRGQRTRFELEYPCHSPNEERWFLMHAMGLTSDAGRVIVSHVEISSQKRVEHVLRQTQADLEQAQAIGQIGSWRLDRQRRRLTWSKETERIFGGAENTPLAYSTFLSIVHPDDRDQFLRCWKDALRGKLFDVEHRIVVAGRVRWVRERAEIEFDGRGRLTGAFGTTQDITDRKDNEREIARLNQDLRRRVTELQAIFDTAPIGLAIAEDSDGLTIRGNPANEKMLGLPPSSELSQRSHRAAPFRVFADGQEVPVEELPMQRAVCGEKVAGQVVDVVRADGSSLTLFCSAAPLFDERGAPRGAVGAFLDVSALKRAEEALRTSERRFRAMVQAVPSLTFEADAYGNNTFASESWCAYTGMTSFETAGSGWVQSVHPADRAGVALRWAESMRGGRLFQSKHRIRGADGTYRWFTASALPIRDSSGAIERWAGSLTDIDSLVRSEAALREREAHIRQLLEALPQLVWTCLPDGRCNFLGRQWLDYTGRAERSQLGRGWLRQVHPEDRRGMADQWNAVSGVGLMFEGELRVRRADGAYHWFQCRAVPLRSASGGIVQWLAAATDIEDLKQAEQALRRADRRKDEFLAMLSHELRNPLAPIRSAATVLRTLDSPDPRLCAMRDIIARQVDHMTLLIDDLLDVTRITRGQIALKRSRVDMRDVVRMAVEASRPVMDARQHRLTVAVPEMPVSVDGDPVRLVQIVTNLLRNAAKYTDERGAIQLVVGSLDERVAIRVRDNGMGIPSDFLPYVFDVFAQGVRTLDRSQGGLGLGLSLAKRLAEMHGGTIEAKSQGTNCGSEFVVYLPRFSGQPEMSAETHRDRVSRDGRVARRVLVVDDNRDAAEGLSMLLSLEGHDVRKAYDGPSAIDLARGFQPDVILLDIGLPGMDGFEVASIIRQTPELANVDLIAITGYAEPEMMVRSREVGFRKHLIKPVGAEDLAEAFLPKNG